MIQTPSAPNTRPITPVYLRRAASSAMPTNTSMTTSIKMAVNVCISKPSKFVDEAFDPSVKLENAQG
jgi:hypothetical protein